MVSLARSKMPRIAVVDDEEVILESWREVLADRYRVDVFSDPLAAQRFFDNEDVDLALLDLRMPGMDGLALMEHLRNVQPLSETILVTGHATIETAVRAIQSGAYDFLCKPVEDIDAALHRIESALEHRRLRMLNDSLRTRLDAFSPSTELIGDSRGMRQVRDMISQVAESTAPVLVCGESGTGKELVARALHRQGARADKPFVAVNCGAMTETLIESELFGHERGAFTGAVSSHTGLFEAADGGDLFLDEIGEVPLQTQVRLLRALQEGEIRPVGSTKSRKVNVRIIAATNADLERAMRNGQFREDLYYRISTFRIDLPALRERREDIPLLAQHLLDRHAARNESRAHAFSDEALSVLVGYPWPGNVRELNNVVEHAATLAVGERIEATNLPAHVAAKGTVRTRGIATAASSSSLSQIPFSEARTRMLDDFERRYLMDLLNEAEGNISEASRQSGIDRSNLRRLLRRHGVDSRTFRAS